MSSDRTLCKLLIDCGPKCFCKLLKMINDCINKHFLFGKNILKNTQALKEAISD